MKEKEPSHTTVTIPKSLIPLINAARVQEFAKTGKIASMKEIIVRCIEAQLGGEKPKK